MSLSRARFGQWGAGRVLGHIPASHCVVIGCCREESGHIYIYAVIMPSLAPRLVYYPCSVHH